MTVGKDALSVDNGRRLQCSYWEVLIMKVLLIIVIIVHGASSAVSIGMCS